MEGWPAALERCGVGADCGGAESSHEWLTFSFSRARDIFIPSVLRHRIFNLRKESKFRMERAPHHRTVSVAETLKVHLSGSPSCQAHFECLE